MRRRWIAIALIILIIITVGSAIAILQLLPRWLPHEMVCQLTGEDALNDTTPVNVYGADIGLMVSFQSRLHFIFGDTFGPDKYDWRSNTIAYTLDSDPSDGIMLTGWITDNTTHLAKELIHSAKIDEVEMTVIPTAAYANENCLYIFYMSVITWDDPGGWTCNNASIAYSFTGHTFHEALNISWPGDSNFIEWGLVKGGAGAPATGGYLYFLATGSGRFRSCYLARVPETEILNQSSYQYFTGLCTCDVPFWSTNYLEAQPVLDAPMGEISVMWNNFLGKYMLMNLDDVARTLNVRTASSPWGPWSPPYTVISRPEYVGFYAPNIDPLFVEEDGRFVYFTMSLWNEYNVYLLKVELTQVLGFPFMTFDMILISSCIWLCITLTIPNRDLTLGSSWLMK